SGHTAAEFYTNRTVVHLMTEMLEPQPGESIYDPTCGSGGMLLSCIAHLRRHRLEWRNVRLYGQERNLMTSSIARMNCFLHGIEDFRIERGDTLAEPRLVQGDRLMCFDVVLANPPYSIKQWDRDTFASDPWGRNRYGTPPQGRADYAFWQHILQSLASKTGRCAILFPHGILFRQEEADMRRKLIEADAIECVLGLGPNLFYNSPMEACVVICRTAKAKERRHKILFINAVNEVTRERAQSFLTDDHIERIVKAYEAFADTSGFTRVVGLEEIRARDGNLSIPLYISALDSNGQVQISAKGSLRDSVSAWLSSATDVRAALATILGTDALKDTRAIGNKPAQMLPAWIKHDEWKRLPFGEFAQSVNERVEPSQASDEIYVGLEHLDPQDLHIRRWGKGSDVIGTKLRFRKGDLIFGRRRAYQRKLAVAEFDGICSAHAMVVRARPDVVLPEFLPILMMSDRFMNRAVEISVGSLSPTINWTTLKREEFTLPPLAQQRRIAEILWAVDEVEQNISEMLETLECAKAATVNESVSAARKTGQTIPLIDGCHRVTDGTHQPPKFIKEGIPFFLVKTISSGRVDWGHTKFVSQQTYGELTKRVRPKRGDILYTVVGATYGVALLVDFDDLFVFQRHIAHIIPNPIVLDSGYLSMFLNSPHGKRQSDKAAIGSAQPTVTLTSLSQFQVPCPPLEQQKDLVMRVGGFDAMKECTGKSLEALRAVRANILNEVLA
ncbi:MAG: N-6 DNA methylase, partial [Candidatus Entotheonellia bacterium]